MVPLQVTCENISFHIQNMYPQPLFIQVNQLDRTTYYFLGSEIIFDFPDSDSAYRPWKKG